LAGFAHQHSASNARGKVMHVRAGRIINEILLLSHYLYLT
jgi:hypothetical protein